MRGRNDILGKLRLIVSIFLVITICLSTMIIVIDEAMADNTINYGVVDLDDYDSEGEYTVGSVDEMDSIYVYTLTSGSGVHSENKISILGGTHYITLNNLLMADYDGTNGSMFVIKNHSIVYINLEENSLNEFLKDDGEAGNYFEVEYGSTLVINGDKGEWNFYRDGNKEGLNKVKLEYNYTPDSNYPEYMYTIVGMNSGQIPTPIRDGYTFYSWYYSEEFNDGDEVSYNFTEVMDSDYTIYAKWIQGGTLEIIDPEYNTVNGLFQITVLTDILEYADVYIDGVKVGPRIDFLTYGQKIEWTTQIDDTDIPYSPKDLTIERDPVDPTKARLEYDSNGDRDNIIEIVVKYDKREVYESNKIQYNIQTPLVKHVISLNVDQQKWEIGEYDDHLLIPISQIPINSNISMQTEDDFGNKSGIATIAVPNEIIYNTVTVEDVEGVKEGLSKYIDAKINDIHDPIWPQPSIKSVEILNNGKGSIDIRDASEFTDINNMNGQILYYQSVNGFFGEVEARYYYEKVRDDIPAASGTVKITVTASKQIPTAVNDGLDRTGHINATQGNPFTIPASLLLENDIERDNHADLELYMVSSCSAGTVAISADKQSVIVTPNEAFSGNLTFQYRVTNGELYSNNALVTVYVMKQNKPPRAKDVTAFMSTSDDTKIVALNVEADGELYDLVGDLKIYSNYSEVPISIIQASVIYNLNSSGIAVPYVKFEIKNPDGVAAGNKYTVEYTVSNTYGSGSATITLELLAGDDPKDMEGYLYVHRKPIAVFSPKVTMDSTGQWVSSIKITGSEEMSYDLDHSVTDATWRSSKPYSVKGIRAWEWAVKTIDGTWNTREFDAKSYSNSANSARSAGLTWIQNTANNLMSSNPSSSVIIALRVRDIDGDNNEGVWSEQRTVLVTSMPMRPIALFTLDRSTYIIPSSGSFNMNISDLSYSPNGDPLCRWEWELLDPTGASILSKTYNGIGSYSPGDLKSIVESAVRNKIYSSSYSPGSTSRFKLILKVKSRSLFNGVELDSDTYAVSFEAFRENKAPVITDKPGGDTSSSSLSILYEKDNFLDGVKGDSWGEAGRTDHKGQITFNGLFTITDDQPVTDIRLDWQFDGQSVPKRSDYNDSVSSTITKLYPELTYSPFQNPFTNTVTDQGFKPGAYKITVTAVDDPPTTLYPVGAFQMTIWNTYSYKVPYHLYVVPKLDIFRNTLFNGWVNSEYRESDGKTYAELGYEIEDIVPTIGETVKLRVTTNRYVDSLSGFKDDNGNSTKEASEQAVVFTLDKTNPDGSKEWSSSYTIEDAPDAVTGVEYSVIEFVITGNTTWGSDTGAVTRTKKVPLQLKVMSVKLYDFRVTEITDPEVAGNVGLYKEYLIGKGVKFSTGAVLDGIPVSRLAFDTSSNQFETNHTSKLMSKGYSFYFKLNSKGMTKDDDAIWIYPRLYEVEFKPTGAIEIGNELAGYVPNTNGEYKLYTPSIAGYIPLSTTNSQYELFYDSERKYSLNNHHKLVIPKDLRVINTNDQVWSGRYGVPANAKFFRFGTTIEAANEYKGAILVTFEIQAIKNGSIRYNYVSRGQWLKERTLFSSTLKTAYATKEAAWKASSTNLGTVLVFNSAKNLVDDYRANPVWNE